MAPQNDGNTAQTDVNTAAGGNPTGAGTSPGTSSSPSVASTVASIVASSPVITQIYPSTTPSQTIEVTGDEGTQQSSTSDEIVSGLTQSTRTVNPSTPLVTSPEAAPASSSPAAQGHGKFTTGSFAGGIVGAALGAAIITFLATFLLCRKRNRRGSDTRNRHYDSSPRWAPDKGGMAVAEKPASQSDNVVLGWQVYFPQSADDRTVKNAVKTLFDQIELHVDNYYSRAGVDIGDNVKADLTLVDSKKLPSSIEKMMSNPHMVLPVIKHCITDLLVSKIVPGDNPSRSLLPGRLAMAPSCLGNASIPASEYNAVQQAYSQWRRLNAWLFPATHLDTTDQRRLQNVSSEIADAIYLAFMPWQADRQNDGALKEHAKSLIKLASNLGQLILAQGSAFEFEWTDGARSAQWDILPGFWKMSDEQGRPLDHPQSLVSAVRAGL